MRRGERDGRAGRGCGAGRDVAALLDLAVLLHAQVTEAWLRLAGAPVQWREQAAVSARRAAERRDTPTTVGLALKSSLDVALAAGAFGLAQVELDTNVGVWRMAAARESGDPERAATIAAGLRIDTHA